jgi:hypothetical protein
MYAIQIYVKDAKLWFMGESMWKYAKKYAPCNHSHIYDINMKKSIKNFLNFHYEAMVHSIDLRLATHKVWNIKKNKWKVCSNLARFSNFKHTFI